jgi:glycine/D-amino acid oxidase-like deaminating enzyme
MKVLIVGAGVIGTIYGAQLTAAGATVSVLSHGPRTDEVAAAGMSARDVLSGGQVDSRRGVRPARRGDRRSRAAVPGHARLGPLLARTGADGERPPMRSAAMQHLFTRSRLSRAAQRRSWPGGMRLLVRRVPAPVLDRNRDLLRGPPEAAV